MKLTVEKSGQYRKHKWVWNNPEQPYSRFIVAIIINNWLKFDKNVQIFSTEKLG